MEEKIGPVEALIRKLPEMCGAKDSWGRSGQLQYRDELENPEPFKRVEGESFSERCISYTAFIDYCTNPSKAVYGIRLLEIVDAHSKGDNNRMNRLIIEAEASSFYADINEIMTLQEAIESFWTP